MRILETPDNLQALLLGLDILVSVSYVDDTEVSRGHMTPHGFCYISTN